MEKISIKEVEQIIELLTHSSNPSHVDLVNSELKPAGLYQSIIDAYRPLFQSTNNPGQIAALINSGYPAGNNPQAAPPNRITFLPCLKGTATSKSPPKPGAIAVVVHPFLQQPESCLVLGSRKIGDALFMLVSFLDTVGSCYVSSENVFTLDNQGEFVLGEETKANTDILIQKIVSTAQEIIISSKIAGGRVGQMSVVTGSYLVLLFIALNWDIPKEKLKLLFDAITAQETVRFESSKEDYLKSKVLIKKLIGLD